MASLSSVQAAPPAGPPPVNPPVLPPPPPIIINRPPTVQNVEFSDEAVGAAIEKGVKFLYSAQKPDGSWAPYGGKEYPVGPSAIAAYALLESGAGAQTPKMRMAIDWLARAKAIKTYELGLRCNVWLLADKQLQGRCRSHLDKDVKTLIAMGNDGGYSYTAYAGPTVGKIVAKGPYGDNSNTQYAVLGAWAAARDGKIEIPDSFWNAEINHWLRAQNKDGGWTYGGSGASTGTMTCAGIASTLVCMDNLRSGDFLQCKTGSNVATRSVEGGLAWLEKSFTSGEAGGWQLYYYYGIERVGLASGMKYFGAIDWYKTLGKTILGMQQTDGSWSFQGGVGDESGKVVGTGYALLILIRGRQPLLFNKLQFSSIEKKKPLLSDWNCRPRDLAHLCAWIGETFETNVNWQVINTRVPVSDWHDAPILYISGSQKPNFTSEEIEKLRQYVYQGGTIFSCAECSPDPANSPFSKGMRDAYAKIFPDYELVPVDPTHDIYSKRVGFDLQGQPKFSMITNNVRPLAIHVDEDLPRYWQANQASTKRNAFEAASNMFMYVTDQGVLRSRASHSWPEEFKFSPPGSNPPGARTVVTPVPPGPPNVPVRPGQPPFPGNPTNPGGVVQPASGLPPEATATMKIVRLKWAGNWNPEPLALERFSRMLARQTHIQLTVADPVDIADIAKSGANIAILSGQGGKFKATPEQLAALRTFAQNGGTLIVDAAGGDELFAGNLSDILRTLMPGQSLVTLTGDHPIYKIAELPDGTLTMPPKNGAELKDKNPIRYRRRSVFRLGDDDSRAFHLKAVVRGLDSRERAAIFYSREDLTNAGLVGYYSFAADGYDPGAGLDGSAYRVMRNIVLYAMGDKARADAFKKLDLQNAPPPVVTPPVVPVRPVQPVLPVNPNPTPPPTTTQPAASQPATSGPATPLPIDPG